MKKITHLLLVIIMLFFMVMLSSCSAEDTKIQYDIDNHTIFITTNISNINQAYDASTLPDMLTLSTSDGKAYIKIDMTKYTGEEGDTFTDDLKAGLSFIFPDIAFQIDALRLNITKEFFGTSMAGTEYYTYTVSLNNDVKIPVEFVSTTPFMLNGQSSERLEDGKHVLKTDINILSAPTKFDLQSSLVNFDNVKMIIDLSTSAPHIEYTVFHNSKDTDGLKRELIAMGFSVDFCDNQQVVFSDKYNNFDDFLYVFPMRNFSMLGIVTTVDCKYGSFFSDALRLNLTMSPPEYDVPVSIVINSQSDTDFEITTSSKKTENTNSISFELNEYTMVNAEYNNFKMFDSITSLLAVLAIIAIVLLMIYVAIKK